MNARHDHLVARLEAMLTSLRAADAEAVAAQMDEAVAAFAETAQPFADPRVLALFDQCTAQAQALLASLHREVGSHATSRRAASAYGGHA